MKKVTVLRLSGCPRCGELLEKLADKKIAHKSLDADRYSNFADEVEDLLGVNKYPITIIEQSGSPVCYVFIAETYKQVGTFTTDNAIKIGVTSVSSMLESILKL